MSYINSDVLLVSKFGIRQGIVYNNLDKLDNNRIDNCISSILLSNNFDLDKYNRIYDLAINLAEHLDIKLLEYKNIICTSSKMFDIGKSFDSINYYKYSYYYLINNKINGLTDKEQLMSSYIIRFLNKNNFNDISVDIFNKKIKVITM